MSVHVSLDKEGAIYSYDWSPDGKEFAVVYGFMPAKAVLFNTKCEKIFDFGTGPRSVVQYNPQGNILLIAGFGNLRGDMQFWSRKDFTLINQLSAPDTTQFEWCPDGQHIVTATCSPRLKVDNGFTVWNYTTGQIFKAEMKELFSVGWEPGIYPTFPIIAPAGSRAGKPKAFVPEKKQAYRPPGLRGTVSTFKLREDEPAQAAPIDNTPLSKTALKNKKKREAARAKAANETGVQPKKLTAEQSATLDMASELLAAKPEPDISKPSGPGADLEKKIRNLNKKLRQVEALKEKQAAGELLQANQIDKIAEQSKIEAEIVDLSTRLSKLMA